VLVLVIVSTGIHSRNPAAATYIGLAVALGVMAGANLTGGAMNPARAFASAIWGGGFDHHWVYWVGLETFVAETVAILDELLSRMRSHQHKKTPRLWALHSWQ
jgi:glycerol uptake facilitator-like aquaporin